jgi:hypothetical protein
MVPAISIGARRATFFVLICAFAAASRPVAVGAQEVEMRWNDIIEDLSTIEITGWPAPSAVRLSRHPVSKEGRYVVFSADVSYDPTVPEWRAFRRDRSTGETRMLIGAQVSAPPVISLNGRHVAFTSCEPWLPPDYSPGCDVYVVDTESWTIVNASAAPDGKLSNGDSNEPKMTSNGEYIVFRTNSTTLLAGPTRWLPAIRGNGYNAASSNTTITVLRAPLLIRADDTSKQVGGPLPSFTARASGFVNGDSIGSLNGTLVFATARGRDTGGGLSGT